MEKVKRCFLKLLKSIEESQMAKAQRIVANSRAGIGRWE
jgi:hypothetical protein